MNAFEFVTIGVSLVALALTASAYFRPGPALRELGRSGSSWFDHSEDLAMSERPSEDELDAPLPVRQIRARPF